MPRTPPPADEPARGLVHELNNLLGSVLGLAHLVAKGVGPGHPSREDAEEIVAASARAAQIARALASLRRPGPADRIPLDLSAAARRAVETLPDVVGSRVRIRAELSEGLPPILADAAQIERILLNFALLARDAMPRGGTFGVETRAESPQARTSLSHGRLAPGSYAVLTVHDTGPGPAREERAALEEPLGAGRTPPKGPRLCLAIIRGIADAHGAAVDLPAGGRGLECRLYFPAYRPAGPAPA